LGPLIKFFKQNIHSSFEVFDPHGDVVLMLYEALEYHSNSKPYLTQQFNAFIAKKLRAKF